MTHRAKQLAPTAECLEGVYRSLEIAEKRVFAHSGPNERYLQQAIRHTVAAVTLLADVVDRHITAADVEARVDGS